MSVMMSGPPNGTRVWLAAGRTDMRKGFTGLSALVQNVLALPTLHRCPRGHRRTAWGRYGSLLLIVEDFHSVFLAGLPAHHDCAHNPSLQNLEIDVVGLRRSVKQRDEAIVVLDRKREPRLCRCRQRLPAGASSILSALLLKR